MHALSLQRKLLFAMLLLLGLAALAGVATVFVQSYEFVGRIAGTLGIAALALGCSIPFSKKLESEDARDVGVVGLSATIFGFGLWMLAIWGSIFTSVLDEDLFFSALAYFPAAIPAVAMFSLFNRKSGRGRVAGLVGMTLSGAVFAFMLMSIWTGWSGDVPMQTALVLLVALAPLAASLYGDRWPRERWLLRLRWLGVLGGCIGVGLALYGIIMDLGGQPTWIVQGYIIAIVFGLLNVLLRLPLLGWQKKLATVVMCVLFYCGVVGSSYNILTFGAAFPDVPMADLLQRLIVAGVIVLVCGLLALAIITAMNRRAPATGGASVKDITKVHVTCPRCSKQGDISLGQDRCTGCGLILFIKVAEPRCIKCNYALSDLRSSVCPECGWPIGKEEIATTLG